VVCLHAIAHAADDFMPLAIPLRACLPAIQRTKNHKLSRCHAAFLEQPDAFAADFEMWMRLLP
jgi:hypothetical protein